MKVILLRDVAKLGKRFSVTEVPDGFALNKLIPQGFAQAATVENLKRVNERSEKNASARTNELSDFKSILNSLKDTPLKIKVDANAQDNLFKSVKASDLAAALATAGHALPVSCIKLDEPIKALGIYPVNVSLGSDSGVIIFEVVNK